MALSHSSRFCINAKSFRSVPQREKEAKNFGGNEKENVKDDLTHCQKQLFDRFIFQHNSKECARFPNMVPYLVKILDLREFTECICDNSLHATRMHVGLFKAKRTELVAIFWSQKVAFYREIGANAPKQISSGFRGSRLHFCFWMQRILMLSLSLCWIFIRSID